MILLFSFFCVFLLLPAILLLFMPRVPIKEFLRLGQAQFNRGFGKLLGIHSVEEFSELDEKVGIVKFRYKVPPNLCFPLPSHLQPPNEELKYLPLSSIMALFDEASTLSLMVTDKFKRPGVSVVRSDLDQI